MPTEESGQRLIVIHCPQENCGHKYKVKASLAGQKVKCSGCGSRFVVGKSHLASPAEPASPSLPASRDAALERIDAGGPAPSRKAGTVPPTRTLDADKVPTRTAKAQIETHAPGAAPEPEADQDAGPGASAGPRRLVKMVVPAITLVVSLVFIWSCLKSFGETRRRTTVERKSVTYQKTKELAEEFQAVVSEAEEDAEPEVGATPAPAPKLGFVVVVGDSAEISGEDSALLYARKGQPMLVKGSSDGVLYVEVFLPGRRLAGHVNDDEVEEVEAGQLTVQDIIGYRRAAPAEHEKAVKTLAFKPDRSFLASLDEAGRQINIWDVSSGGLVRSFEGHPEEVASVAFLRDGTVASAASDERGTSIWDPLTTATLKRVPECRGHFHPLGRGSNVVELTPGGPRVWDLTEGKILSALEQGSFRALRVSLGGEALAALTSEGALATFSLPDLKPISSLSPKITVADFDYSHDRQELAIVPKEGEKVTILDSRDGRVKAEIDAKGPPLMARFVRGGKYLAIAVKSARVVQIVSVDQPKPDRALVGTSVNSPITAMAFSPDGRVLALGHGNGAVLFLDVDENSIVKGIRHYREHFVEVEMQRQKRLYGYFRSALMNKLRAQAKQYLAELEVKYPEGELTRRAKQELEQGLQAGAIISKGKTDPKQLYNLFRSCMMNKAPAMAKKYLDQLVRNHPEDPLTSKAKVEIVKGLTEGGE